MADGAVDLLIVGAGINGAGIARDAAMRGLQAALVDKGDFGCGTSSRSSRLIHGGLPYLEHGQWRLVFASSQERRILLQIAPHLVTACSFLVPIHDGTRISRFKLETGLWLYDLLTLFRNVRRHRMMGKRELLRAEPGLRVRGLRGGARYWDAVCDDARLTLANVRDAHRRGALVANYAHVDRFEITEGRVRGARVIDLTTGSTFKVRAAAVVNATGPWSDEVRATVGERPALRKTKGVHLLVPRQRLGNREALTILSPIDGRVIFIVPQGALSYVGTTDTDSPAHPDDVRPGPGDVVYLLRSVNAFFPDARLTPEDVRVAWAGLRPLVDPGRPVAPGGVPREHAILEGPTGLISVIGGDLTTYRRVAAGVVDEVTDRLHALDGRSRPPRAPTDREFLPGGEARDLSLLIEEAEREGFSPSVAEHLVRCYGTETPAITRMALSEPPLAEPVIPGHPVLRAELYHAMRREMAVTLSDLLIRRTHLFYEVPNHAIQEAPMVADMAAREMVWDPARTASELAAYLQEVKQANMFREGASLD
jgi:glycerol-3-phosphate dehydrogenase